MMLSARSHRHLSFVLAVLLPAALPSTDPALAQTGLLEGDAEGMEATYAKMFAKAVEATDRQEVDSIYLWSAVQTAALGLEVVRAVEEGGEPNPVGAQEAIEWTLERWRELRPNSVAPEVWRIAHIPQPAERRSAILDLLNHHPDNLLVVQEAARSLRSGEGPARATELVEAFVARNPERSGGYQLLHRYVSENEERHIEVLQRWAQATPGDPHLVAAWMASPLPDREPGATASLLDELFARQPTGAAALKACRAVHQANVPGFTDEALTCLRRLTGDEDDMVSAAASMYLAQE